MIERYCLPETRELWTESAKYQRWLDIELAIIYAQTQIGLWPEDIYHRISQKAHVNTPSPKGEGF